MFYLVLSFQILCMLLRHRSIHIQLRGEFINNFRSVSWVQSSAPLPRHILFWVSLFLVLETKVESQFMPIGCILPATLPSFETKKWEMERGEKVNQHFPYPLRSPAPWTVKKTPLPETYALAHHCSPCCYCFLGLLGSQNTKNSDKQKKERKAKQNKTKNNGCLSLVPEH